MTEAQTKKAEEAACACCGRTAPKETMVKSAKGEYYCCNDCAEGKECECGE